MEQVKYEATDTLGDEVTGAAMDTRLLRVYCDRPQLPGYNRVMVVLEYETQEMDYFNADASAFLKRLMKKYKDKGVNLTALYSDEMHIQQDWGYFGHHEGGQFAERYLTQSMADAYAEKIRAAVRRPVYALFRLRGALFRTYRECGGERTVCDGAVARGYPPDFPAARSLLQNVE